MDKNIFFAAFALLLAGAVFGAGIDTVLNTYAEPGENITTVNMNVPSGNFVLVRIGGADTFMVRASDGTLVEDEATVVKIYEEIIYVNADYDSKVAGIRSKVLRFNSTRSEKVSPSHTLGKEDECLQYVGIDESTPCVDFDSCKTACLSSPLCAAAPYFDTGEENATGYLGMGFVESMLAWMNNRNTMDSELSAFLSDMGSMRTGGAIMDTQVNRLKNIKSEATAIGENKLYVAGLYGIDTFCPGINFTMPDIDDSVSDLKALKASLAELSNVNSRKTALLSNQNARKTYIAGRGGKWSTLKDKVKSQNSSMGTLVEGVLAKVNDTALSLKHESFRAIAAEILFDGETGRYMAAFSREGAYDGAYFDLNTAANADKKRHEDAVAAGNACLNNVKKARTMNQSSETTARLGELEQNCTDELGKLGATVTPSELESIKGTLESAKSEVNEIIVGSVGQGGPGSNGTNPPGGSTGTGLGAAGLNVSADDQEKAKQAAEEARKMCPVGAVLALVALFAFVRKE